MKRNKWVIRLIASLGLVLMLGTGLITGGNTPRPVHADEDPTPTPTPTQGGNGQPGGGGGGGGVRLASTPTSTR